MVVDLTVDSAGAGSAEVVAATDVANGDTFFDVFIDLAADEPNDYLDPGLVDPCSGRWTGPGTPHPLAKTDAKGTPTFPVSVFSLCMGELENTATIPSSKDLAVITITKKAGDGAETGCTVSIAADDLRGNIVDPNGDPLTVTYPADLPIVWDTGGECYVVGQPRYWDENNVEGPLISADINYPAWVAAGKPACWCCPHHGYGDVNGDGSINSSDVPIVWNAVVLGQSPARADVNHDGSVNSSDVPIVWNNVQAGLPAMPATCPDCP
jgi:hypothetical protein